MKPPTVTIAHAATLHDMTKECQAGVIGAPVKELEFEAMHITYQEMMFRLAQRLVAQGWRPKRRKAKTAPPTSTKP